jgi:2-enoate reductase
MSTKYKELFEPAYIGKVQIKNKLSMAPMGPVGYADALGAMNQRLQEYYVERAKGGIGLIITGICSVDLDIEGMVRPGLPCPTQNPLAFIHEAYQMNERIHAYGTKIFLQLTGGLGRSALPGFATKFIAPSENENRFDPRIKHREMTLEEIKNMIQKFVMSAVVAKKAGFDGVEIHAVHEGYLLDQFAIALFNRRTDEYGGSLENRLRVATDIVKGVKAACGPDFPVSLRYSLKSCMKGIRRGGLPGEDYEEAGKDIEEGIEAAKILVAAGYDALNVDAGTYDSWYWNHPPMYFEDGMYREFGRLVKQNVDVPVILAGRMENPEMAIEALGDSCDIIGLGRQLLTDPYYPEKVRTGRLDEIRPCLGCHEGCLGRIANAPVSCAVNPACGREKIYGLVPANKKKHVLVIGGGIAGMEAARVLAERGHRVTLCEKSGSLGGNLIPGSVPHFKRYDRALVKWYQRQLELLNVEVEMNCEITADNISNYKPDEIITATGSKPIQSKFGSETFVTTADDILLGKAEAGKNVVVIGGGLVGCETALWLAQNGSKVTVIEMQKDILGGHGALPHMNHDMLVDLLAFQKVDIYTSSTVKSIEGGKVTAETPEGECSFPADTVISAIGYRENHALYNELKDMDIPVHNIGDSQKVHNIMYSIWNSYELAREL